MAAKFINDIGDPSLIVYTRIGPTDRSTLHKTIIITDASYHFFTQRRSVANSVGCFQQRLFVCFFVNTITPERVNIG